MATKTPPRATVKPGAAITEGQPLGNPPVGWVRPERWISPPLVANRGGGEPITVGLAGDATDQVHPYDVPWDYRVSQVGPQGETLPYGAIGWTPLGTAYYGGGLGGYLRGMVSRLMAPVEDYRSYSEVEAIPASPIPTVVPAELRVTGRAGVAQAVPVTGQQLGQAVAGIMRPVGTAVSVTGQRASQAASTPGGAPSLFAFAGRAANETVRGILAAFQLPAQAIERYYMGTAQALHEAAGEEAVGVGFGVSEESMGWFSRFMQTASPQAMTYNLARIVISRRSWPEVREIIGDSLEASRIAYSGFLDPAVRADFIRRSATEDPVLLAMELQRPGAELVGQLIFDPLNLLAFWGKGATRAGRIASTEREFLAAASDDVGRVLDDIGNVVADGVAAERIAELGEVQRAAVTATRGGLAAQAEDISAFALTAGGKRSAVSRRAGELFGWISSQAATPDDALETIRGLAMAASDDPNEIQAGLSLMMDFPAPRPLFSQAGNELGVVLRDVMSDSAGHFSPAAFLDDLRRANTLPEVLEVATRRMVPVVDRMFPTITERIAAGERVSPILRGLARFDAAAQSALYRPINRFFANIYMGMSPGYAFRNAVQNSMHVFADYGPRAAAESLGGAVRQLFRPGEFVNEAADDTARWLGGQVPEGLRRGLASPAAAAEITGRPGVASTFLRVSERMEQGSATVAVRITVEDTMRRMLQPGRALPDAAQLIAAGLPRETADTLMRLVVDNYGDVRAATTAFRQALGTGNIDAWRTLSFLPGADVQTLSRLGVEGEVARALQTSASPQEFRQGLDAILSQLEEQGGRVAAEHSAVADDAIHIADAVGLSEARASGALSDETIGLAQDRYQAMENVLNSYEDGVRSYRDRALFEAGAQGRASEVEAVAQRFDPLLGRARDVARRQSRTFTESVIEWRDRIVRMPREGTDWAGVWRNIGIPGEPPPVCDYEIVRRALWEQHFYPHQQTYWMNVRNQIAEASEAEATELGRILGMDTNTPLLQQAREAMRQSQLWDSAGMVGGRPSSLGVIIGRVPEGETGVRLIAQRFGIPTADQTGRLIPGSDAHILNAVNAHLPEGVEPFTALRDIPQDVAQQVLRARATVAEQTTRAVRMQEIQNTVAARVWPEGRPSAIGDLATSQAQARQIEAAMTEAERAEFAAIKGAEEAAVQVPVAGVPPTIDLVAPMTPGSIPSFSRAVHEQLPGIRQLFTKIGDEVEGRWGQTQRVFGGPGIEAALGRWETDAVSRVAEARLVSGQVGNAMRDFTLLNYQGRRYVDLALGYIFPYQFWYSRTYAHWLQRLVSNPEIVAAYAKYRGYMETIHAGMPEWWRYNVNSNELLGLDSENPLFFNLEATLNPLNGLTGVDFNDPYRRVSWWTAMLSDLNRFGPSTWTPFSIATALALHAQGEEEAAARWGGRLVPQTATIQAASSLLGVNEGIGLQLDPSVAYFSGGLDPYERRRVGRALGAMVEEGLITSVQAIDAARIQSGDIWNQARVRQTQERAPGQLASFFLGVGFRSRSVSDLTIDQFYGDYYRIQAMEPNLSPDEYRNSMDRLRGEYPFMDALLLSRPSDSVDRDRAYAYNVLSRIPPSQSDDYATWAGISPDLLSAFYEQKGHMEEWQPQERQGFMAGILDLGAILDLPDSATRSEWSAAKTAYNAMLARGRTRFGEDIWERVDTYYGARGDSQQERDRANAILASDPQIEAAMDFRSGEILGNTILSQYYGSIRQVESYWRGFMYAQIERELGAEVYDTWDEYYQARLEGTQTAFWREHPELQRYRDIITGWEPVIAGHVVDFGERIPDRPSGLLREDMGVTTYGGQAILGQIEAAGAPQVPQMSIEEWRTRLGETLFNLTEDTIAGEELPYAAETALDEVATGMGLSGHDVIIELLRRATYAQ